MKKSLRNGGVWLPVEKTPFLFALVIVFVTRATMGIVDPILCGIINHNEHCLYGFMYLIPGVPIASAVMRLFYTLVDAIRGAIQK